MKKNILMTFLFSLFPGAGQMYQGYMRRGISILICAAICLALSIVIVPIFAIPIVVLFVYSFFDTFDIRNRLQTDTQKKDEYVWNSTTFDNMRLEFPFVKNHTFWGISLILLGIYLIFNNVISSIAFSTNIGWLRDSFNVIRDYLPSLLVASIAIIVGSKLISKKGE